MMQDIQYVSGVGEARAKLLNRELGIRTVGDLLNHFPFRYIDRTRIYPIREITEAAQLTYVQLRARILGVAYAGEGRKKRFTAYAQDETGRVELVWFQGIKWIEKKIEVGREYLIFGRPSFYRGELQLAHPEIETMEQALSRKAESGMQGIYPSTEKITSSFGTKGFYRLIQNAWALVGRSRLADPLPEEMRREYGLLALHEAYYNIHFPQSAELLRQAQYRLKFDELLGVQLGVQSRRTERLERQNGFLFPKVGETFNTFYNEKLPFPLTGAQKRVIKEIRQDTVSGFQMNRLLQGDVGSGKTAVAASIVYTSAKNGMQSALMAPTEVLAVQHFETFARLFENSGIRCELLTGSTKAKEKKEIKERLKNGEIDLIIGTHALIQDDVEFSRLGLVITDEQHRFGVKQRTGLCSKGDNPHVYVMSATPIPRTLALIFFGDLNVSILDELPPGRQKIDTYAVKSGKRGSMFEFIRKHLDLGYQAYIVCPLVEESELVQGVMSAEEYFKKAQPLFPNYRLDLLHGKMTPKKKDEVMMKFKNGETQLLISTVVIEVGVDVPNAVIMVIENAERFGLSQLHQLRGRVGRGKAKSHCILVTDATNDEATARMNIMCQTTDGFKIADEDLKLRGPGDFFGTRQHGLPKLRIADILTDTKILMQTQDLAQEIMASDCNFEREEHRQIGKQVMKKIYSLQVSNTANTI